MFTNDKLRLYLFAFLAFCVASSKNIIIYNEETLVAFSFFLFVIFVSRYFGTTIQESLNERSQAIQQELQNFFNLQQNSFQELLAEHQKILGLVDGVESVAKFTTTQLNGFKTLTEKALRSVFQTEIQAKFKTLAFSKIMIQQNLQALFAETLLSTVLVAARKPKSAKGKSGALSSKTIQNALDLVATAA